MLVKAFAQPDVASTCYQKAMVFFIMAAVSLPMIEKRSQNLLSGQKKNGQRDHSRIKETPIKCKRETNVVAKIRC